MDTYVYIGVGKNRFTDSCEYMKQVTDTTINKLIILQNKVYVSHTTEKLLMPTPVYALFSLCYYLTYLN